MHKLRISIGLVLFALICLAAVNVGAHSSCAGAAGNSCTTGSVDTTDATNTSLFVGSSGYFNSAGTAAVTDSKSNSYTGLTAGTVGLSGMKMFYVAAPTKGSGTTWTSTLTAGFASNCSSAFTGVQQASPFIGENGGTASATTVGTGNVTVAVGDLVVTAIGWNSVATASINNSFTITDQVNFNSGQTFGCALAWKVAASTTENATWTLTATSSIVARIAGFHASSGGGSATNKPKGFTF